MSSVSHSEIAKVAREMGFECSLDPEELRIVIAGAELVVSLDEKEPDGPIGFDGTPWHFHSELMMMTSDSTFVQYGLIELLGALKRGEALVYERFVQGTLEDRWISHKDEPFSLSEMEPGEELRIRNVQDARPVFQNSFESVRPHDPMGI